MRDAEWVGAVAAARRQFLDTGAAPDPDVVRPEIADSWRRSTLHGLTSDNVALMKVDVGTDSQLLRVATPVIEARLDALGEFHGGLTLSNENGVLLDRWVGDKAFERRMDRRAVFPGFSVAETYIGTNGGGTVLELEKPTIVIGPEHFADDSQMLTSAAAPVRHPLTHRLIGTLSLSFSFADTNSLLMQWVVDLAQNIEAQLLRSVSTSERLLLDAYLRATKDSRHPVLCLGETTVIGNTASFRALDRASQAALWEGAARAARDGVDDEFIVGIDDSDAFIRVQAGPILDGSRRVGALLRMRYDGDHPERDKHAHVLPEEPRASMLGGLAGRSVAWREFCSNVSMHASRDLPLLLVGERGVGKTVIASALARHRSGGRIVTIDLSDPGDDVMAMARSVDSAAVVFEGVNVVTSSDDRVLEAVVLELVGRGVFVIGTATMPSAPDGGAPWFDIPSWPGPTSRIPAVRDRLDDLPLLLQALTAELGGTARLAWSGEAVQSLRRVQWPANVSSLRSLVRTMLAQRVYGRVNQQDLPAEIRLGGARRDLAGLEHAEARAILEALRSARGNKRKAADSLGIARSTLYRKMRSLGLDLTATNY